MSAATRFPLVIKPKGRLGNQMFQLMLATRINQRLGESGQIFGYDMPEWRLRAEHAPEMPGRILTLKGHLFDLDEVAYCLSSGLCDSVLIEGWGMRLEYFPDISQFRQLFNTNISAQKVEDGEVLIHIRAEDIESGAYPGYFPLPFDFYDAIIQSSGLKPVFMGQVQPGRYLSALRGRFPSARFMPTTSLACDFQTIRQARHLVLSISSFAWLAAWLSESAKTIHLPVTGIFDPSRGRQNLLPVGDQRYQFWEVPFPSAAERAKLDIANWAHGSHTVLNRSHEWARTLMRTCLTVRLFGRQVQSAASQETSRA